MRKIISFILGALVALNLSVSVANSAAKEVRVAYFLEWPSPNLEDMQKKAFAKALGVPVKWTNFTNGGAMTDAMLAGDIDISYSQGLVPFINAVKSKAPIKLVDIAMEYGMGGTTCVTSNASGITKANATELEGKKVAVPLGTMAEYVFDESMKVVGADRGKMDIIQMDPEEGAAALVSGDVVMACLFGGNSIKAISKDNFDNDNFKFGTAKYITIEGIKTWAQRLSYVGELGYELYVDLKDAKKIYELLIEKGKDFNLSNCGMHAMDIMRMESGFLHWGHDISPEENQYQAGLSFTISKKKDVDFIGKKAIEKIKQENSKTRFAMFTLKESEPGKPLLLHDEPIYIDDKIIGRSTSGNYSFNFKKNLVFGYIKNDLSNDELQSKNLFIEVEKKKYPISIQLEALKRTNYKNL